MIYNNLIKNFINQVELAKYLNLHKLTIGKYLKSRNLLLDKYFGPTAEKLNNIYNINV
jgi:hypothetical protein